MLQMYIGDGAKLIRNAFELAKEKAPAIIFIDELDAIGTKRFDSDKSGDREVQRTMLELLNQLDGFGSDERIKVGRCPGGEHVLIFSAEHWLFFPPGHCSDQPHRYSGPSSSAIRAHRPKGGVPFAEREGPGQGVGNFSPQDARRPSGQLRRACAIDRRVQLRSAARRRCGGGHGCLEGRREHHRARAFHHVRFRFSLHFLRLFLELTYASS